MLVDAQVAKLTEANILHRRCFRALSIAVNTNICIGVIRLLSGLMRRVLANATFRCSRSAPARFSAPW